MPFSALHHLFVGSRVHHPSRGPGVVAKIDINDKRGKMIHIDFENGEEHHYSLCSAAKFRTGDLCVNCV